MAENARVIPTVDELDQALRKIIGREFVSPEIPSKDGLVTASPLLTLECVGGPEMPRPEELADRMEAIRTLLRKLVFRLCNLSKDDLEAARISVEPFDSSEEAARIAEAAEAIFQLHSGTKPKPRHKKDLYEQARNLWVTTERQPHSQWFKRSAQFKLLLAKLAEWLIEAELAHRSASERPPTEGEPSDEKPPAATVSLEEVSSSRSSRKKRPVAIVLGLLAGAVVLSVPLLASRGGPNENPDLFAQQPPVLPAPPADKEFGGGEGAELNEPTCGVLADSEPDPADANPRLAFIDMAVAARRIRQPPEDYPDGPPFADIVKIRPFEVVQVSALVQNQGPAATARNVVLRLVFPMHSSTRLSITATVEASNARPAETYRNAGVASLVSLTGEPLRLENFRNVQVQRNEATRTYSWGRFESFDSCALESKRSDRTFEVAMPSPSVDGSLGVGRDDAYRIVMLADVSPG
jgi:hypothetical protein